LLGRWLVFGGPRSPFGVNPSNGRAPLKIMNALCSLGVECLDFRHFAGAGKGAA
jgi:hypothetical protein